MSWQQAPAPKQRGDDPTLTGLQVILAFVALLWAVQFLDMLTGERLEQVGGIEPRETSGIDGILFAPMLHGSWGHLMANTVPLVVFGFILLLAGVKRWAVVTAIVWLVGGAGVWITGGDNTVHVGASILVFGWLVYLLMRGFFSGRAGQIGVGIVLFLLYGGILFGVLPGQPGVSWQGHLFGAIGGGIAAWRLGRTDRG